MVQGSSRYTFNLFSIFVYLDMLIILPAAKSISVHCGKLSSPLIPSRWDPVLTTCVNHH